MPWCGTEDRRSCYSTSQHTRTSAQTHMHMHTHRHKCTQHTHAHTYTYMHTHMNTCTPTHTHTHTAGAQRSLQGRAVPTGAWTRSLGWGPRGPLPRGVGALCRGCAGFPRESRCCPWRTSWAGQTVEPHAAFTESGLTSAGASGGRRRGAQVNLHLSSVLLPLPHAAHCRQGPPGL